MKKKMMAELGFNNQESFRSLVERKRTTEKFEIMMPRFPMMAIWVFIFLMSAIQVLAHETQEDLLEKKLSHKLPICQPHNKGLLISGKVIDANTKNPIPWATVKLLDKDQSYFTDSLGNFQLLANSYDKQATVIVSSIGYTTENIIITFGKKDKEKKDQLLYLKPSQKQLDEVVVVGYGIICKHERGCICGCWNKKNKKSNDSVSIIPSKIYIKEGIRMYPNLALKNSSIHIVINEIGKCELLLTDNQSRSICLKQFTIQSAKETYLFNLPNEIASGIYYIRLINKESKRQWLEKLIVQ